MQCKNRNNNSGELIMGGQEEDKKEVADQESISTVVPQAIFIIMKHIHINNFIHFMYMGCNLHASIQAN